MSPHIRILSLRLWEQGTGLQSGHPTLPIVIQWELWYEYQCYIRCGCSKHKLARREAITATQPAIYQRNWGCRMGQHCSLWIELKWGLSRSDTPLRGQEVLISTRSTMCICVPLHKEQNDNCGHSPEPTQGISLKREGQFIKLELQTGEDSHKKLSNIWKKVRGTHTRPHVHDSGARTNMKKQHKERNGCLLFWEPNLKRT